MLQIWIQWRFYVNNGKNVLAGLSMSSLFSQLPPHCYQKCVPKAHVSHSIALLKSCKQFPAAYKIKSEFPRITSISLTIWSQPIFLTEIPNPYQDLLTLGSSTSSLSPCPKPHRHFLQAFRSRECLCLPYPAAEIQLLSTLSLNAICPRKLITSSPPWCSNNILF